MAIAKMNGLSNDDVIDHLNIPLAKIAKLVDPQGVKENSINKMQIAQIKCKKSLRTAKTQVLSIPQRNGTASFLNNNQNQIKATPYLLLP